MSITHSRSSLSKLSLTQVVCLFLVAIFLLPSLACFPRKEDSFIVPENPKQYTAETAPVDVYVLVDSAGNMVDFGGPYAYGTNAKLRYVLRFWDVGSLMPGYEKATISRVYTPYQVMGINKEIEMGLSEAQKTEIYARTSFPSTEVPLHELEFLGVPVGDFYGTNSETGKDIRGYLKWEDDQWKMGAVHVIFTEDIKQDYLVLGEEVFFNWP